MTDIFTRMLTGEMPEEEIERTLLEIKERGETVEEVLAAATAMRANAKNPKLPSDVVDVCGTGGDGLHTLNVSTAVAFVLAGCGVKVAKHGNKAVSSKSGSSDIFSELGIDLVKLAEAPAKALEETNLCYLHAPLYHPAMKHVAPIRAKLQTRTIFNLLGPLSNPAQAKRQLIGVYDAKLLPLFAKVLQKLGTKKAWIVHGDDGLDEISISGKTQVAELDKGAIDMFEISSEDAGLTTYPLETIKGGEVSENAKALEKLLDGDKSAYRDIVLFNTAAALIVAEKAEGFQSAVALAEKSIDSGTAKNVLTSLQEKTK